MTVIHEYPETSALASAFGQFVIDEQNKALKNHDEFLVAISGGSLINVMRKALVDNETIASQIQWPKWHVYFSDERLVPLEHADSNYGAFKKAVLDELTHKQIAGPTVYTINESLVQEGGSENEKIAQEYELLLPSKRPFDLILLGCGPDGHTCSLFPGPKHAYLLDETHRKVMWCHDSPKPPSDRITITLPVVLASETVAFVAEGSAKKPIMDEIFNTVNKTLPCTLVNLRRSDPSAGDTTPDNAATHWFVSSDAIAGLRIETAAY